MGRQRLGRETAFKALYRMDLTGKGIDDAVSAITEVESTARRRPLDEEARRFALELLETVGAHRSGIDGALRRALDRWRMERLTVVDRALLRLGAAEILHWPWIPLEVTISEYVEIAKKFSTEQSSGFVHAVLDRVARDRGQEESREGTST